MNEMEEYIANTYSRFPITLVRGEGCRVWDDKGKEYLDFTSGIAVCSLGHCHPEVTLSAQKQMESLVHVSNLYWTLPQEEVAQMLCRHCFADKVFFSNSGAEAVESAIKLARIYGHARHGKDCFEVISLKNSFHGRTLAALAATGQVIYQQGFEPMPEGFVHVEPNDISGLEKAVNPKTAAILLEPIQGEGGVRPLEDDFLKAARDICDEKGILLMFDEVQVGMGRTGTLFAYEQTPVVPDVLCLAKALGNGFPVGAMLSREDIMSNLSPGTHASTFGGNPVSCAAAKAVLDVMTRSSFLEGVKRKGEFLKKGLERLASDRPDLIKDVRGRGLITAMEFKEDQPDFALRLLKEGLLAIFGHNRILRLLPPLIIGEKDIDEALETIERLLPGA